MARGVISILFIPLLLLSGCLNSGTASGKKYMAYMEDEEHELKKEVVSGGVNYSFQLATPEYMACKEFGGLKDRIDTIAFYNRLKETSGYVFFLIRISNPVQSMSPMIGVEADAEEMVMYYQSAAAYDIQLLEGKSTHPVSTYLFENNYGLAPYNTIIAGFKREHFDEDLQLVFTDRYHDNPLLKASFTHTNIQNIPTLSLN